MSDELQLLLTASLEITRRRQASGDKPLRWVFTVPVIIIKISREPLRKFIKKLSLAPIPQLIHFEAIRHKMAATNDTKMAKKIQSILHVLSYSLL